MASMQDIREYANRIAERFKPVKIILFGSYAYGQPTADSDVDLLVVAPDEGNPLAKSMQISREVEHPGFPLDLIVRDPDDLQWRIDHHDWFLQEILEKGKVLYESPDARVGSET